MKTQNQAWVVMGVLSLALACGEPESTSSGASAAPQWHAVVAQHLEQYASDGLPEITQDDQEEVLDLLDLAISTQKGHRQAYQVFAEAEASWVTSVMLSLVEGREADAELKAAAYTWLREFGTEAMLPRLTLRLKYEKNWAANVDIALGLLRFGCGAGLDSLINILRTEEGVEDLDHARWAAIGGLEALPAKTGWTPGANFDDDWNRLLQVERAWRITHLLPGFEDNQKTSRAYRAEIWKTLANFQSQRLRPVDDARFVLMRQPTWAFDAIVQTTYDEVWYVREHALQTLDWTGAPVGRWAHNTDFDLAAKLSPLLGDGRLRGRVLEAMGASGLPIMQDAILPWLREGNLEESTAAADALLRCANQEVLRPIEALLASNPYLSPEGRYALNCLRKALDSKYEIQIPEGIDPSEIARRDRWAAQRFETL